MRLRQRGRFQLQDRLPVLAGLVEILPGFHVREAHCRTARRNRQELLAASSVLGWLTTFPHEYPILLDRRAIACCP
jgi:hypothetical protein